MRALGGVSGAAIRVPGVSGWTCVIPAVPVPLRVFCDLLRRDQGWMLGSAVLFASVVGLDVVEQRKGDIAAITGVPATRVQEIVATGRQALSSLSPKRPEQHVVSQVIPPTPDVALSASPAACLSAMQPPSSCLSPQPGSLPLAGQTGSRPCPRGQAGQRLCVRLVWRD